MHLPPVSDFLEMAGCLIIMAFMVRQYERQVGLVLFSLYRPLCWENTFSMTSELTRLGIINVPASCYLSRYPLSSFPQMGHFYSKLHYFCVDASSLMSFVFVFLEKALGWKDKDTTAP